jgi:2-polyprenyl-6-hydroxyphenyl methylase/3-demethylubiquinone-9 3-methyltransferase
MSNVDTSEVAKFDQAATQWWKRDGEFQTLHDINPLRTNYVNTFTDLVGKRTLDVGCGGGILSESLARRGAIVTGIDMGEANLDAARAHAAEGGLSIDYRQVPVETLASEQPGAFEVITCMEMLEHVPDPSSIVSACAALATPGAWLVFSTLNRNPKAWLTAIVGAEYVLRLIPQGTHDYMKFIKPSELSRWCRAAGLEVVDMKGMSFNPITRDARLTSDVSVNYFLAARKR